MFALALPLGVITQSATPAFQRVAVRALNGALAGVFRGSIEVQPAGRLTWRGVEGGSAVLRDSEGRTVLRADGVRIRLDTPRLLRTLLSGGGALPLDFRQARARSLEVTLSAGPDGQPTVVRALELAPHEGPPGRPVSVELDRLEIDRLVVSGMISHPLAAHVLARGAFGSAGNRAVVGLDGAFGEMAFRARAAVADAALDVRVDVDAATSSALPELSSYLAPGEVFRLHAEVRGGIPVLWASLAVEEAGGGQLGASATLLAGAAKVLDGRVSLRRLDPGRVLLGAPRAALDAQGHVLAGLGSRGGLEALLQVSTPSTRIESLVIPAAQSYAAYDGGRADVLVRARGDRMPGASSSSAYLEGADLQLRARVDFHERVTVGHASLEATRGGVTVAANVGRVEASGGHVALSDVVLTGLGEPARANFETTPEGLSVRLKAPSVDLPTLQRLLGQAPGGEGRASLDLDFRGTAEGANARATAALDASGMLGARRTHGVASFTLSGRSLAGRIEADRDDARIEATLSDGHVAGRLDRSTSWSQMTGSVDVESTVPLPLATESLSASQPMQGVLSLRAHVVRRAESKLPVADIDLSTSDFAVGPSSGLHGVDVQLHASVDGPSGRVEVHGDFHDRSGTLATVRAETKLPMARLLGAPGTWKEILERAPAEASVEFPRRDVASLPSWVIPRALKGVRGTLAGSLTASGTVAVPHVELHLDGRALAPGDALVGDPLEGEVEGRYDGQVATARVTLSRGHEAVLDGQARVNLPLAAWLRPEPSGSTWDAQMKLGLHAFPLQSIPALAQRRIAGAASGELSVDGFHRDARAEGSIRIDKPRLGGVCLDRGEAIVRLEGARATAEASFGSPGTSARLTLDAPAHWGAAVLPSLDPAQPVDATLVAQGFPAGALLPLLEGPVTHLDGRIDANASAVFASDLTTGTSTGDVRLSHGVLEIPALGERFEDVTAKLSMGPWGTFRLDDVTASSGQGRATASAFATFDGVQLRSATAEVDVPHDKRLPLTLSGVPFGQVSGHVHAEGAMTTDGATFDTRIAASHIEVELPGSTGRSLQGLTPAEKVAVGARLAGGRFVAVPTGPPHSPPRTDVPKIRAMFDLGELRVRRDVSVDVTLKGHPVAELDGDKLTVHGVVELPQGKIEVFGKRFALEPSTIGFVGDPENPQLHVTAKYDAPDKTNIYADATGTPSHMKLALRSDPPRSQDEIFGLLLFGSENGLGGTPPVQQQTDVAQRAAGLASGVFTQGLNEALSGITSIPIATRVDTSQATNPRPMVEVRLSSNVVTRVTVQTGIPAPGEPRDLTLVTFDWRFHPQWSLQTTVGDAGSTAIEVLWRRRY